MTAPAPGLDGIILGAGASGLLCALTAGRRGRRLAVIDHARRMGEKIRISGGGHCNFSNHHVAPERYVSDNPRFCRDALSGYPPAAFLAFLARHDIAWREKGAGQLFCSGPASAIVEALLAECRAAGVAIQLGRTIRNVAATGEGFVVTTDAGELRAARLVVATGGRAAPGMGATGFGYGVAQHFGLAVIPPRPGLVPLTFSPDVLKPIRALAGISLNAEIACAGRRIVDDLLFTHRGLSGPAILRISNLWREGEPLRIDLAPGARMLERLLADREAHPRQEAATTLSRALPQRLARALAVGQAAQGRLAELGNARLRALGDAVHRWQPIPAGTEGWRTAEVTLGGVDTRELDAGTMAAKKVPGLFFIGEVVDVTGDLGGFNLHWAWASGHAAGAAL